MASLIEATLSLSQVQPYLHAEVPGRVPVVVATSDPTVKDGAFVMFGQPVVVRSPDAARASGGPFFEVLEVSVDGQQASTKFRYAVEGVSGRATFERVDDRWHPQQVAVGEN